MKQFLRDISPRRALGDFMQVWRGGNRHRWGILGVAIALTLSMLLLFLPEGGRAPPQEPDITWVATFAESRTQADIIASNCANQRLKDQIAARVAEREELRRDMYAALGRATFIDVDELERKAAEDRRKEAAAAEQAKPDNLPEMATMTIDEYCAQATSGAAGAAG